VAEVEPDPARVEATRASDPLLLVTVTETADVVCTFTGTAIRRFCPTVMLLGMLITPD